MRHTHTHRIHGNCIQNFSQNMCEGNRPVVTGTSYTKLPVTNTEQQKIDPLKTYAFLN